MDQILSAVGYLKQQAAVTNGLPASTMATESTDESGVARIVGNRELEEMRADDIALFLRSMSAAFSTCSALYGTLTIRGGN